MLLRLRWAAYRLVCASIYTGVVLTGGLLLYVLAPLITHLMFRDPCFWRYLRLFPAMRRSATYQFWLLLSERQYRALFRIPFTEPPATAPDPAVVRISPEWQRSTSTCPNCSCCCQRLRCALLDPSTGLCRAYDSFYWRYFNCGRYPTSQAQIDYYACPKWQVRASV